MGYIDLERKQQPDSALRLRWTGKARTVVSAAVYAGGQVILADWSATITALDAETGKQQWSTRAQEGIIEPLFLFDGLVWALDLKGNLNGYEIATGQHQASYQLTPQSWGLRHAEDHIYFVERTDRSWSTQRGRAVRLNLRSGERTVFAEGMFDTENGYRNNTVLLPEEGAVLFFLMPDIVKFAMDSGDILQRWSIPQCRALSGLLAFGDSLLGITDIEKPTLSGSRVGTADYLTHNPNSLLVITPTQTLGYPLVANGVYDYETSAVQLFEAGRYLLEAGEWLFLYEGNALQSLGPLPNRRGWGNHSAGMFKVEDTILIFQRQERVGSEDEGYYLQAYEYAAGDQTLCPLGLPMKTNPHGKNYRGASIVQFDHSFLLCADGRYHYLIWTKEEDL
jgi:hypothetical protein